MQGEVQLAMISDTPDQAYEVCTRYCPPCDQPSFFQLPDRPTAINTTASTDTYQPRPRSLQALEAQISLVNAPSNRRQDEVDEFEYDEEEGEEEDGEEKYNGEGQAQNPTRKELFPVINETEVGNTLEQGSQLVLSGVRVNQIFYSRVKKKSTSSKS